MPIYIPTDEETAEFALKDFFKRSQQRQQGTGVPPPFIVSADSQQFDTAPLKPKDDPEQPNGSDQNVFPPPPSIDHFTPYFGDKNGGDLVDIYGSNFIPEAKVYFDGNLASGINVINQGHIQVNIPSNPLISNGWYADVNVMVENVPGLNDTLGTFHYQTSYLDSEFAGGGNFISWGPVNTHSGSGSFRLYPTMNNLYAWNDLRSIYYFGTLQIINVTFSPAITSLSISPATTFIDGRFGFLFTFNWTFDPIAVIPGASGDFSFQVSDLRYGNPPAGYTSYSVHIYS